jgi:hypothetical protein
MDFGKLIERCRSREEAQVYKAFTPDEVDLRRLGEIGKEVLKHIPPKPGACALMSAVYAARLQHVGLAPAYVVAGSLDIRGHRIFGDCRRLDWSKAFSESNLEWNGHAWVMFGPYIADISIFRTAYSNFSPPRFAAHIRTEFGEGRGLLAMPWSEAPSYGLRYSPQYVLTEAQISGLYLGAMELFARPIQEPSR